MLHIVNKSPLQTGALASCLRLAKDSHALLLTEDAVVAATRGVAESSGLTAAAKRLKVYALAPDLQARGLADRLADGISTVDYAGFVDLVAEHATNQSWL
jgi:tRNA 2-thiouridine synthesizing protein B